jgi:uncharacterized protein (UPF0261 family)
MPKIKGKDLKTIAILGTLNTKATEVNYIREKIIEQGHHVIVIDVSLTLWDDSSFQPDIGQQQIAEESGIKVEELTLLMQQEDACAAMIKGATSVVGKLYRAGKIDGIIALGGSVGTSMGCAVMRSLPLGVPKVIFSTFLGDIRPYVGIKDIVFFPAITDIVGLNRGIQKASRQGCRRHRGHGRGGHRNPSRREAPHWNIDTW